MAVTRQELMRLGATIDGHAITPANLYFAQADQAIIDGLQLDPAKVTARMLSATEQDGHLVSTLMFEIATLRSNNAVPLMKKMSAGEHAQAMNKVCNVLNAVQRVEIQDASQLDQMPGWIDKTKSRAMTTMGAGMQMYGLYSAYRGTIEALKSRDWNEAAINGGGAAAEIASLGLEYALTKTGESMIRNGALTFEQFGKTTAGSRLVRGSGLIASALTLPFDVYTAVKSFSDAASAEGKKAQDLYVTGGLSVFSAGLSLALGAATLMGFQFAGPVGLTAAAIMIVGAQIYAAARIVDDIDDYIELTVHERLRSGWFAFTGQDLDQEVMDRFKLQKTYDDHLVALKSRSVAWLENELRDTMEAIVNGRVSTSLQPTQVYKYTWDEAAGESPYTTVNVAALKDSDDTFDARNGLPENNGQVTFGRNDPGKNKGILWHLGGGDDTIQGVTAKSNAFVYGWGKKHLKGGDLDDTFAFQSASEALSVRAPVASEIGHLQGGAGTDLLWLQGKHSKGDGMQEPLFAGYDIDLENGALGLRSTDPAVASVLHSHIDSFEKIETLKGASNRVRGTAEAEVIGANGRDQINAGGGDDQITISGSHATVDGGAGSDTYLVHRDSLAVSLIEDGQAHSTVSLGVALESIQSWRIRDHALVIESVRGEEPYLPRRELSLEAVYQTIDGQRVLRNDKWTFITTDGYYLQPDCPAALTGLDEQPINVIILSPGTARQSPRVLNDYQTVPANIDSFYYVSSDTAHATLNVPKHDKINNSTVYIDHDSQDITEVRAHYDVTSTTLGGFELLSYPNFYYTLLMRDGVTLLSLHGGMVEDPYSRTSVTAGHLANTWKINHEFILVMRDGVSYRVDLPQIPYLDDSKDPGHKVAQSRASLRERAGKYMFIKPRIEKLTLKNSPQRIDFQSIAHARSYHLEGRSSHYDIYPSDNMSLRLSTADEDIRASGSSTWTLYTAQLKTPVLRSHLSINGNLLKVGSLHIHLPDSNNPGLPIETIDVALVSGNCYRVNNLFEIISLFTVDAMAHSSIAALTLEINNHKDREELSDDEIPVKNIYLQGREAQDIHYNAQTASWHISADRAREVRVEDLRIGVAPATR